MDNPSDTTCHITASTELIVSCFNMARGLVVGGMKPRIYVVIDVEILTGHAQSNTLLI
jgi:hypothetical protein